MHHWAAFGQFIALRLGEGEHIAEDGRILCQDTSVDSELEGLRLEDDRPVLIPQILAFLNVGSRYGRHIKVRRALQVVDKRVIM